MPTTRRAAAPAEPALAVRGPDDLVHAVPYLLGFHPRRSLVVVGMRGGRLVVTARMDLDDLARDGVLAGSLAAMSRGGAEELVAVVFDEGATGPDEPRWRDLVSMLWELAADHGSCLRDVLLVDGQRRWSLLCGDPACCPAGGVPLNAAASVVPASATLAGLAAYPDREALAASLAPAAHRETLLPLVSGCLDELAAAPDPARRLFAAARAGADPAAAALDDDTVAAFGAALRAIPFRDAVWLAVDDGRVDGRPLWQQLARRLPAPFDAAPLFLLGWASWRAGNGALANMAAERALAADPGYTAADLLLATLTHGLDPRRVPRLRPRPA